MKYLSGILVAALVAGPAIAADMRVKAPLKTPPPAPVLSWTGCYVGGNAGGLIGADQSSLRMGGDFLLPGQIFSTPAHASLVTHFYTPNPAPFTGGPPNGCHHHSRL